LGGSVTTSGSPVAWFDPPLSSTWTEVRRGSGVSPKVSSTDEGALPSVAPAAGSDDRRRACADEDGGAARVAASRATTTSNLVAGQRMPERHRAYVTPGRPHFASA